MHLPLGDLRVHSPPLGVFYNPKKTARPCLYRSCLGSLPFGGRGARSFSLRDTTGRHVSEDCYRVPVFFLATTLEPEAFPCAILPRPNYHATASCPFPITITTYPPTTPVRPRPHLSQPTPSPCRLETRDSLGLHRQWPDSGSLPPKTAVSNGPRTTIRYARPRRVLRVEKSMSAVWVCTSLGETSEPGFRCTVGRCLPSPCALFKNLTRPDHALSKTARWTRRFSFARPTSPPMTKYIRYLKLGRGHTFLERTGTETIDQHLLGSHLSGLRTYHTHTHTLYRSIFVSFHP